MWYKYAANYRLLKNSEHTGYLRWQVANQDHILALPVTTSTVFETSRIWLK